MSAYFTTANLSRAACVAGVAGLMAVPRILDRADGHGLFVFILIFSAFPLLTIIAGTATAWGECGGMRGIFPDWRQSLPWITAAVVAGLLFVPAMLWYDSFRQASLPEYEAARLAGQIPKTPDAALALILWSAGFETILFQAGVMSFVARLTGSSVAAISAGPAFKLLVYLLQCANLGFSPLSALAATGAALTTGIAGILYARAGLPAAMAFNAITSSRFLLALIFVG